MYQQKYTWQFRPTTYLPRYMKSLQSFHILQMFDIKSDPGSIKCLSSFHGIQVLSEKLFFSFINSFRYFNFSRFAMTFKMPNSSLDNVTLNCPVATKDSEKLIDDVRVSNLGQKLLLSWQSGPGSHLLSYSRQDFKLDTFLLIPKQRNLLLGDTKPFKMSSYIKQP